MKENKLSNRSYWYVKRLLDIILSIILIIITMLTLMATKVII